MPSLGPLEIVIVLMILAMFVVPIVIVTGMIRGRPQGAEDLLRQRLARGEIDEAEYRRLRSVLHAR
ncbi:MAG: SHOCT domain-containing protein [Chloroflexota bacterium]